MRAVCAPYTQQVKIAPFVPSRIRTARGCMAFCIFKEETFRQLLKKSTGYLYSNREFFTCYDTIVVRLIIGLKLYTLPEPTCKPFKEPRNRFLAWRAVRLGELIPGLLKRLQTRVLYLRSDDYKRIGRPKANVVIKGIVKPQKDGMTLVPLEPFPISKSPMF